MPKTDARRLLKQQRAERQKRIEHPFAKYDDTDQLVCIVCNSAVRSAWPVHLHSASHKESVARLKAVKQQQQQLKRRAPATAEDDGSGSFASKRARRDDQAEQDERMDDSLPADFFDNAPAPQSPSDDDDHDDNYNVAEEAAGANIDKREERPELPTGFFDDPNEDARVRKAVVAPPSEQQLDAGYAEFQQLITSTTSTTTVPEKEEGTKSKEAEDDEDEEDNWGSELRRQAALDARVAKLKAMREQGVKPSERMAVETEQQEVERVAYDTKEYVVRTEMKQGIRKLMQKPSSQPKQSVFDDMDEDEDTDEEEDDWRAQQL